MTHEDDFIRIHTLVFGTVNIRLAKLGLDWPPPQLLIFKGEGEDTSDDKIIREPNADDARDQIFERIRMSQITDEQIEGMKHIIRGAEYKYLQPSSPPTTQ